MTDAPPPKRSCPACGSEEYRFRHRQTTPSDPDKGEPEAVETKYRCAVCEHEWKERIPK
jgi:DNA-directed RNA polymerase subunit M/transcription elongation factor TFIIS